MKTPGEDFWRTMTSSAIGLWRSLDRLHDDYCQVAKQHPGKVPLVELIEVVEIKGRTTSYAPTFGIIDWVRQRRRYMDGLKMTKQELKDEYKEMEGNPQVRSNACAAIWRAGE